MEARDKGRRREALDVIDILKRAREAFGARTDAQLARLLGVAHNTIPTWRKRRTLDYALILSKAVERGINLQWLLTGEPSKDDVSQEDLTGDLAETG
jgi:hypothetical protein